MEGGCLCGNIRYTISGEPAAKALCHCLDCRKISGSTYSTNAVFPLDGFKFTSGTPKEHFKVADGGNGITSHFCGDCGSMMTRRGPSFPGLVIIKAGTLDDKNALSEFKPVTELFAKHRVDWVPEIPGAQQKEGM